MPADDPGMAVKMSPPGFAAVTDLAAGRPVDESPIADLCAFVDARIDCADFRALTLVMLLEKYDQLLSEPTRQRIRASLTGFRYWMDEPGEDSMCFWSENHQAIFATCEYFAGRRFAGDRFADGRTGAEHHAGAERRLRRWLELRARFGFSEWLSNTYYEEDSAPLALLVDHAEPDLAGRARHVLDLLLRDLATHSFQGRFGASGGRTYERQKKQPETADVTDIVHHAFGFFPEHRIDHARMSTPFVLSSYRVPDDIVALAHHEGTTTVTTVHGIALDEVSGLALDADDEASILWAMEAFTTPQSIRATMDAFVRWGMHSNGFLSALAPFARLPRALLPTLVRLLNPATSGTALQRAVVRTHRTPHGMLSSAQRYHPRTFGDQQHLWQATLPGDVSVFSTHPGGAWFDDVARNFSPSAWVGNGRIPDVAQHESVLVALHDTRGRRGYLEKERARWSHLYWPRDRFSETREGTHVLVGRAGDGLLGILAGSELHPGSDEGEIVQNGVITGWAAVLSHTGETTMDALYDELAASSVLADRRGLRFVSARGAYELPRHGPFTVNGVRQDGVGQAGVSQEAPPTSPR